MTIPQQVLDRYSQANDAASSAASTPFQQYSTDPNAFVAPLNATQNAGVAGSNAYASTAQPYYQDATGQLLGAQANAQPYIDAANSNISGAQSVGSGLAGASLNSLNAANANAAPLNQAAGGYYSSAYQAAQPYNAGAGALIGQGLGAGQQLNNTAAGGYSSAYAGAQPYNQAATGLAAASGQAVDPSQLNVGQYLSPYLQTVLGSTAAQLQQDNGAAMSGQTGNAIQQGAFGGDRAGIAAANLQRQQTLANNQIYSGILNTGYNNALGAAQQQQGVGLSAAQANRTALGAAGQQLSAIGQQQYSQGTGTAGAQAALGQQEYSQGLGGGEAIGNLGNQVYSQGTGTGSAVQGLGQQEFGQGLATSQQQAAVGQQQYEQGLGAAQAQAALGQQQYGMGANTSQDLAALGSGAQAAGLSGAQAQLAAGQVGQQTQQAGDTALYNQFLQQQSYPFQTAQFLANVAEGTGSLSGSTTTTTQPGGFFSDKRLKENIRKIGETFDGQAIYSYRYKGDPRTQIGLIAQEVEKDHPDAVGRSQGFRTVDYGKATGDAAKRGHFAGGGSPTLPGLSGADMSALLAAQAQMYAPFSQAGGLYGGQASGAVRGGSSYVPQASLPVSHLAVAGDLPKQTSAAEQMKDWADIGSKTADALNSDAGQKTTDWIKSKIDPPKDVPDTESSVDNGIRNFESRGGGLAGYATGGMPYSDAVGVDIPDEKPDAELKTAGALGSSGPSGAENTKDVAETALDIAKIAAMFKRGGRIKRADGGDIVGDSGDDVIAGDGGSDTIGPFYTSSKPTVVSSKPAMIGTMDTDSRGDHYWSPFGKHVDLHPVDTAVSMAKDLVKAPATIASTIADKVLAHDAQSGATGTWAAPSNVVAHPSRATGLARAARNSTPDVADMAPATAASPVDNPGAAPSPPPAPGLAAANTNIDPDSLPQAASLNSRPNLKYYLEVAGDKAAAAAKGIGSAINSGPVGDYGRGLASGSSQYWLPLLSGIAAAGTAPTVHPGVALAAGLGAGAQSYMGTKKALADVAKTQAGTGQVGAQTTATQQANSINFYKLMQAGLLKADPNGTIIDPATGTKYSNTQTTTPTVGGSPTPTFKYLGAAGQVALPSSAHQYVMDSPGIGLTPNAGNIETSQKIVGDAYHAASDAQSSLSLLNEQAGAILSQAKGGVLTQGALAPVFQPYVEKWNSLVTDAGHPELAVAGLGDAQIAHKLQVGQALAQATSAGQHAHDALSDVAAATANNALDPHAAAVLMAQNAVQATKTIDQRNALEEAKQHAPNGNYEAQDIMAAFDHDNPPTVYNAMRDRVAEIYQKPVYGQIHAALSKPGTPEYQTTVKTLDAFGAQHGIPNFSRVFTGG